ncbi:MAG: hypothetical protein B1H12_03740 [Desulfobacteraceae bacterium 4484_190.2]|nr:MAG: hypothetical protein B1H12_03740 [Desulfobacteraceae bacterium 4484_190.2]
MYGFKLRFFINWIIGCPYMLFIIGVMDLKGFFEISKLLFQYPPRKNRDLRQFSNTPILQRDKSAKFCLTGQTIKTKIKGYY